jgi:two-component system, cell cycle response regulator DivK
VANNGKPQSPRGKGDLILLVEDDEDSRFVYRLLFEDQGFQVLLAASGEEGLRLAHEAKPQAIIMDVSIPGVDGWTATKRLKADPQVAHIPVIVLTAHAFPEDRHRAHAVGCDAFLTKPCEPRRVLEEVRRQLAGSSRPA